jgi:ubiquinone/menaquinone biosynthesis C-methylase UbiE
MFTLGEILKTDEEKNLESMSNANNYNRWIYRNIKPYLGHKILEIGGGVGNMTRFFLKKKLVVSTDVTKYNINTLSKRYRLNRNFCAIMNDISVSGKELSGFSFDTIVCINVLEHIKDDLSALKNMNKLLEQNGHLILMVPAMRSIYGTVDKSDHHFRRYDKKPTIALVKKAGFSVSKSFFMNIPGFFGWYYHGRIKRLKLHPRGDISAFDRLVPVFEFFEKIFKPPFGLSLIIIAKKR